MSDAAKYLEIFDYLSAPELPNTAEPAVVFGRNDRRVAHALGDLVIPGLVEVAVITGGIGKDSGDLLERGFRSEAHYLTKEAEADGGVRRYVMPRVLVDEKASSGGENARFSLALLSQNGYEPGSLTAVAHATSARRLGETLKFEAAKKTGTEPVVHRKASAYNFDPTNQADRDEAASELLRLADWPSRGWLGEQADLPANLVDFARETHGDAPKPVAAWQGSVLRLIPKAPRLKLIQFAASRGPK